MENINILPILSHITGVDASTLETDLFVKDGETVKPIEGFEGKVKEIYTASLNQKLEAYATQKITSAKADWEKGVPVAAVNYLKEQAKAMSVELSDDDDLDTVKQKVMDAHANEYVTKNGYQKGDPKQITEDDIKRHEYFTKTIGKVKSEGDGKVNELKKELEKIQSEFNGYKSHVETERIVGAVRSDFKRIITDMKPVISEGKQAQFNKIVKVAFDELCDEYDVGIEGEGTAAKPVLYEKGTLKAGKPIIARDAAYNNLKWEDKAMAKFREFHADFYDTKKQSQGSGSGSGSGNDSGSGDNNKANPNAELIKVFGKVPTDTNEALDMMNDKKGNAETRKILRKILDDLRTRV